MSDAKRGDPEMTGDSREAQDLAMIERLLTEAARPAAPAAGEAFLSRVLSDALDVQEARATGRVVPQAARPVPLSERLRNALRGGWQVAGGMATAALAGVWLGFAAPGLASGLTGADDEDVVMIPSYELAASFLDQLETGTAEFGVTEGTAEQ